MSNQGLKRFEGYVQISFRIDRGKKKKSERREEKRLPRKALALKNTLFSTLEIQITFASLNVDSDWRPEGLVFCHLPILFDLPGSIDVQCLVILNLIATSTLDQKLQIVQSNILCICNADINYPTLGCIKYPHCIRSNEC